MDKIKLTQEILARSLSFEIAKSSNRFPPLSILNDFLLAGSDAADQDNLIGSWASFTLSEKEYEEIKKWWVINHPGSIEDSLGEEENNCNQWFYLASEL